MSRRARRCGLPVRAEWASRSFRPEALPALEIEFGMAKNGFAGLPEIEVFGEAYVPPPGIIIIVR